MAAKVVNKKMNTNQLNMWELKIIYNFTYKANICSFAKRVDESIGLWFNFLHKLHNARQVNQPSRLEVYVMIIEIW